jgi:SAM-dependent methyltransferase
MSQEDMNQEDKAGAAYWDGVWDEAALPAAYTPAATGRAAAVNHTFHRYFQATFAGRETRGAPLLEIGAAASIWLPYFAREHGFVVSGLDYSEPGCAQMQRIFARDGIDGGVHCADAFAPPDELLGAFDVVVSFGVVEHFTDTRGTVAAFARFLRPGGLLITEVPNLKGLVGRVQRSWNRPVWDIHVPLDRDDLLTAHRGAGLVDLDATYLVFGGFHVVSLQGLARRTPGYLAKRATLAALNRGAGLLRATCVRWESAPDKRATASYVICRGTVPAS